MKKHIYDQDGKKLLRVVEETPECGEVPENYIPFLERLTPAQRKKLDRGMSRLRRRLRNRNKFFPRLKRAIRNF